MLKSVKVQDYMTTKLTTFKPETELFEAMAVLLQQRISGAPVVGPRGELVGMLSETDCLKSILSNIYQGEEHGGYVGDFMTPKADTVDYDMSVVDLAEVFIRGDRRRFPVLKNGKLVGQISRKDVMRAVKDFVDTHLSTQNYKVNKVK